MSRKLQAEIDRVFKKVAEGIDDFEIFCEKVQNATSTSQKEKYEADLKKEIKKLQRLRDQIKVWIQNSEIKDKHDLIHHRKLIEKQMEKFKAIEKEMKTKAYSKEGLSQSTKLDPKERQKQEIFNWLVEMIDKLSTQIDVYEVESEQIKSTLTKKKKDSSKLERIKGLALRIERHKHHILSLERIQRLFENESLSIDQIQNIQDDVSYYVDNNDDDDFGEDESIYDELDLDNEDIFINPLDENSESEIENLESNDKIPLRETGNGQETEIRSSSLIQKVNNSLKSSISLPSSQADQRNPWKDGKDNVLNVQKQLDSITSPSLMSVAPISLTPNIITAPAPTQALAQPWAAVAGLGRAANTSSVSSTQQNTINVLSKNVPAAQPQTSTAITSSQSITSSTATLQPKIDQKVLTSNAVSIEGYTSNKDNTLQDNKSVHGIKHEKSKKEAVGVDAEIVKKNTTVQNEKDQKVIQVQNDDTLTSSIFSDEDVPEPLMKMYNFYKKTKENYLPLSKDSVYRKNMMDMSLKTIPTSTDQERSKQYVPQKPVSTPSYYPQAPLPLLSEKSTYLHLGLDTLFFIFYYQKNTYQQFLAAKELKRQSWRYHKKYLTWFQRFEEPSEINDEYEEGSYLYFDYD
ncbi:hypothetical protein BB558_005431, partial [Smittium angustum]